MSTVLAPAFGADGALERCRDIPEREARLDCFDSVTQDGRGPGHYLSNLWKLGPGQERIGIDQVQPHRPVYVLVDRWTSSVNQGPSSPAPGHNVASPFDWNAQELKFQLSFKAELISRHDFGGDFLGLNSVRLWFAYTQQSHWQLYTPSIAQLEPRLRARRLGVVPGFRPRARMATRPGKNRARRQPRHQGLPRAGRCPHPLGHGRRLRRFAARAPHAQGPPEPRFPAIGSDHAPAAWPCAGLHPDHLGLRREHDRLQLPAAHARPGFRVPRVVSLGTRGTLIVVDVPAHFRPGPASCTRFLSISVISMRRFFFRPSGVSFSATG